MTCVRGHEPSSVKVSGTEAIAARRDTAELVLGSVIERVRYLRPTFGRGEYPWDSGAIPLNKPPLLTFVPILYR